MDGDLRSGALTARFRLPANAAGLAQVLRGTTKLSTVLRTFEVEEGGEVAVLPAGQAAGEPVGLLRKPEAAGVLERLAELYDIVIVDTPPAGQYPDAFALAANATGVLIVVRRHTPARPLRRLRTQALAAGVPLTGLLFTWAAGERNTYGGGGGGGSEPAQQESASKAPAFASRR